MRAWQATLLTLVAGVIGLATGSRSIQIATLTLILVLLLGVGYRLLLTGGNIHSLRVISEPVVAWGGTFTQKIELVNRSRLPIPAIRISDASTLPQHPHGYVTSLGAKRSITWEIDLPCETRGRYRLGPVDAHMSDPLGLFPVGRRLGAASSVLVLPRWVPLARSALRLDGLMQGEVRGRLRGEAPPTVSSVREYTNGDAISSIHWPASARLGQLMTKQFSPEIQTTFHIALDLDSAPNVADATTLPAMEELLVTVAASLGMFALQRANLRVGLVASGAVPVVLAAERGKPHRYRLQESLAEVHIGTASALTQQWAAYDRQVGPGHVLVLITMRPPTERSAWLARLAHRGVAARVIHIYNANEANEGASGDGITPAPHDIAPMAGWPVPFLRLPATLADPERQGLLIAALEGSISAQ